MGKPYALLSDQHAHLWSAFSTALPSGVNSRLAVILGEMERAADELVAAGGSTMVFAGDLFHVRGSIDPEVLNPTVDCVERILGRGVQIFAIPGNHDLKGRETVELGNAMQTLGKLDGFTVVTKPTSFELDGECVFLFPWRSAVTDLRAEMEAVAYRGHWDAIIHAPVNGVIFGIPDHGFDAKELAGLGFKRVFAGHYHNHVDFGNGVCSIGATTHQTWSDIGSKAGFLLVHPDKVVYRASHAPKFVEINADTDPDDISLIVDGNYVRVCFETLSPSEEIEWRETLVGMGAKGVVIHASKAPAVSRAGATVKTGASLESSVGGYIATLAHEREAALTALCQDILSRARAAASAGVEA